MREIKISKNDSGQRLDRFLIKCFPALTMGNICKLARKNCIKLNGKKCDTKIHLAENDIIKLFIKDELLEPKQIDDLSALKLARDIANKIEATMSYPGVIKVNVIRETRAVEYAK